MPRWGSQGKLCYPARPLNRPQRPVAAGGRAVVTADRLRDAVRFTGALYTSQDAPSARRTRPGSRLLAFSPSGLSSAEGGRLVITFREEGLGTPIAGATIRLSTERGFGVGRYGLRETTTDASGQAVFVNLPADDYWFEFSLAGSPAPLVDRGCSRRADAAGHHPGNFRVARVSSRRVLGLPGIPRSGTRCRDDDSEAGGSAGAAVG